MEYFNKYLISEYTDIYTQSDPNKENAPSLKVLVILITSLLVFRVFGFVIPVYESLFGAFTFFSTLVHEEFHCLSAYLVAGECREISILSNLGGYAIVTSGIGDVGWAVISVQGLLAPAIVGSVLMVFGGKPEHRSKCWVFILLLTAVPLIFLTGEFGVNATAGLLVLLFLIGLAGAKAQYYLINLAGMQLHLASVNDLGYMFSAGIIRNGELLISDSQRIANILAPHSYMFWGGVVATFSLILLIFSFWVVLNNLSKESLKGFDAR